MQALKQIIEALGGLDVIQKRTEAVTIESPPFMPLVLEWCGIGPHGGMMVSVSHYYTQNGDLCCDPSMMFEMIDDYLSPLSFEMSNPPVYSEAVTIRQDGEVIVNAKVQADLRAFADVWSRNLREQGFVRAAKEYNHAD